MQAYEVGDYANSRQLRRVELPDPVAGPGEALVMATRLLLKDADEGLGKHLSSALLKLEGALAPEAMAERAIDLLGQLCDAMLAVKDENDRPVFPTGGTRVLALPATAEQQARADRKGFSAKRAHACSREKTSSRPR